MQNYIIFGLGSEGLSSYRFLKNQNQEAQFILVDDKPGDQLSPDWQKIFAEDQDRFIPSSQLEFESIPPDSIVVKTPGIAPNHQLLVSGKLANLKRTNNAQLFFEYLQSNLAGVITVGVTGTKGKTTTTALINRVLREAGLAAVLGGNIGTPALSLIPELEELTKGNPNPLAVLELSSHQLVDMSVSPNIAVLLNITPEHLDHFPSLQDYIDSKQALITHQRQSDHVIYNPEYQSLQSLVEKTPATRHHFGENNLHDNALYFEDEKIIDTKDIPLVGKHQWLNALPSIVIGKHFGISTESIKNAIASFTSLPHRLEYIGEKDGIAYYNDSQATTPEAAVAALRSFPEKSVVLIAGGHDKGVDLSEYIEEIKNRGVKAVALFPPTGEIIGAELGEIPHRLVTSMADAVAYCREHAESGDTILLSPACASFGVFKNYMQRGEIFREEINNS